MNKFSRRGFSVAVGAILAMGAASTTWSAESLQDVMQRRGLSEKDLLAAAKTYVPSGGRDEYVVFASGGQSGQVIVYAIPSMRIMKYIGVFTPEPWQGYGFDDESKAVLAQGRITCSSTTRPIPASRSSTCTTSRPSRSSSIPSSSPPTAAPSPPPTPNLESFNDQYRGGVTYWKFNKEKGRIEPENSFTFELGPYSQDLSDAGKGPSYGWGFTNSFCSERYVGGIERGRPPFEAGCSSKDTDFLHLTNWKKAEELVKAGKVKQEKGYFFIPMEQAIAEGLLYLIPEPKSPHGVDVTPDGKYLIVSGKLDSHVSVYSFEKIQKAIAEKKFEGKDPYGVPIIAMQDVLHTQVNLGLGPLHTQFDSKPCIAYTSLYVDSQVAKYDYCQGKVLDKLSIHYNIGHLMTMEGDTVEPDGKYLVALNKLSIDRHQPVGPLHPQNHQLIDIGNDKMQLLYDMPLPLGEPHYAVAIAADKLKPEVRYKSGTDSRTDQKHPNATRAGRETTERTCDAEGKCTTLVKGTVIRSHITPEIIEAVEGDTVSIALTNLERAQDQVHGFAMYGQNVQLSIEPGKTATATFVADQPGVYPYYCTEFCSALHLEMQGYLLVKPKGYQEVGAKMVEGTAYTQGDYETQVKTNNETQAVIDQVVAYITGRNFKDFPTVVSLVEDATDQLGFSQDARKKSEEAAAKQDWQNAMLWANQWWQYQVKAADLGLRAKALLDEGGAKPTKP